MPAVPFVALPAGPALASATAGGVLEAIWRIRDRIGREVIFTPARRDHIRQEHDDMADRLDDVRSTIEDPDFVTRDRKHARREIHYRRTASGQRWIKVVVQYRPVPPQGTWAGEVITAYPVKQRDPREEELPG